MGINPQNYFLLKDGTIIKNLFELSKALDNMSEDVFKFHVNETKNDFYNWIKAVVKDESLAAKVLTARTSQEIRKCIVEKIEKDIVKQVEDKKTIRKAAKPVRVRKPKILRSKQVQIVKNKTQTLKNKLHNMLVKEKEEPTQPPHYIDAKRTMFGINCPYKTIHCGALEFIFGVILGLLGAFVITLI